MPSVPLALLAFLFETPLTALMVAAGAAAIPVVIHLLNRNRYRVVTWAAMRFLLAAQRKNTRRLRLEQILLLAVRTLMVLLLVLAMASVMPWAESFWQRLFPGKAGLATANRRTHKILVLDGSFSMAVKAGDGSVFDRARGIAERILQESRAGDGFSVVLMAAPPRRVVPEPSDDARKVIDEIHNLRLPHGNADLPATLSAVEDMLHRSPDKFQEREVYFLTDLQRSSWTTRTASDPNPLLQKIQARARTILLDVGRDGVNNLAVTNLALAAPLVTTGAVTPIVASVHNYGSEPIRQKRAELWVGKARAGAGDPAFDLRAVHQEVVNAGPGESATVTFPYKFTVPGDYAIQVRLENDALELDDVRSVVVTVKDTVPVMLVNGKPAAELYDRATEWLKDALNPFEGGLVPAQAPVRPKVVTETQFADPGLGDLTPYDCVFICDMARLSAAEVRRLETHLQRGGGVVFCLGPQVDIGEYNRLLYRNGEGILPARLVGHKGGVKQVFSLYADEDNYKRPPLEAFIGDNDRISLTNARFREYVKVELPPGGKARTLLSFRPGPVLASDKGTAATVSPADTPPAGDPALVAWSRYRGQVVLLTSTVNMDWTSWPISPSYPAFMQELLRFAVAGRLREQATTVGDVLENVLPIGSTGLDVTIHTPEGRAEQTRTQDREENVLLRWTETDTSGLYRATVGRDPREYLFAVNVPTAVDAQQACESDLARTNADELHSTYPGWDFQLVTDPAQVVHTGGLDIADTEGTPWPGQGIGTEVARDLLLVMLILLIVEVVLAWRFGHHARTVVAERPPASGRLVPGLVGVLAGLAFLAIGVILVHAVWTGDFLGFLPDSYRRAIEARFDVPPPTPGEGTRWQLEFTPYLWDAFADPWLAGALALAIAVVVVTIYLAEGRTTSTLYKLLLAGLRIGLVLLTLAVLLPQLRLLFERQSWPDVAIILDDSQSMSHQDHYQDEAIRKAAERLAGTAGMNPAARLQLAQALVVGDKPDWLERLLTRHQVKVHVYHCSGRAAQLADVSGETDAGQHQAALQAIRDLRAEGESSQLGTAVRQVLNDFRGSSLAAVIMLTDGVTTEGEDLIQASRHAARMGVPLFFVGIGDAGEVRDLKLHDLQVEDTVYVNDRLVFEARLTGQGYSNLTVPVILREKDKAQPLATKMVTVDPQGKPVKFRLIHQPKQAGEITYVVEVRVPAQDGKPARTLQLERTVFVRENKLIKVLYVEGYARYEFRYIKNLLERESAQDPRNKTIDLKVLLLDADIEYPKLDKSAVAEFPSKIELNQFDVLIFGDVDPSDPKLAKHLPDVADFVRERGGGFLMIAGEQFSPHAFKDTPLRDILPVEVVSPEPPEVDRRAGYRPELTGTGRFHPIFRFSPDEADNLAVWNKLKEFFWWSECYRAKPGAETLAVHPHRKALGERPAAGEDRHPLVVQQFVGAGRSLFFGFDETWRWRFRDGELHFNQFWIQTVRYLARSRAGRVELFLDRQTPYRRGEPVKITVRFPDDAPQPPPDTAVKVLVERQFRRGDGPAETEGQTVGLAKVDGSRATFEGVLTRTPVGDYRFWLSTPSVTGPKPRAECRVLPPPGEMDRLRMNREDMERAAQETHGRFFTLADADSLFQYLPSGTRITLSTAQPPWLVWNHPVVFLFALGVLTAEWVLRKRKHLL